MDIVESFVQHVGSNQLKKLKTSEVLRLAIGELQYAEGEGESGTAYGICTALAFVWRKNKPYTKDDDEYIGKVLPSMSMAVRNDAQPDKLAKERRFESWRTPAYWARPLNPWSWESMRKKCEEAYTARVLLLEWVALECEEDGD